MISNTTRTRVIRLKRQIGYHTNRLEFGDLDYKKIKLTHDTIAAIRWALTFTYERIGQIEKAEIKDPVLDFLIELLRKAKYLRHRSRYHTVDREISELHALDHEPLQHNYVRVTRSDPDHE